MRLPDRTAPVPPLPSRRLFGIAATGGAAALLVFLLGRGAEILVLGAGEADARTRVEADVRASFDEMTRALRVVALGMADPASVLAAAGGDVTASRRLFEAAGGALAQVGASTAAVTAYGADGRPLAWDGRPSELPPDRLLGEEAWFFTRGELGLRLVYVTPVISTTGDRVGTVAAEHSVDLTPPRPTEPDVLRYPTRLAPVALELRFENGRTSPAGYTFEVPAPSGARLVTATLDSADLARTRERWRRASRSLALVTVAIAVVLLCGPLLDWRSRANRRREYAAAAALIAAAIILARLLVRLASPADWSDASVFGAAEYASPLLRPLLTSPFDFLLTAVAVGSLMTLLLYAVEAWRLTRWHQRARLDTTARIVAFASMQLGAGITVAALLAAYHAFLRDTVANTTLDLLHYSLHPWSTARLALQVGLIVWHATVLAAGVLVLRLALVPWSVPRPDWRIRGGTVGFWALPLLVWQLAFDVSTAQGLALLLALAVVIALVVLATRLEARYRHGSQSFRLNLMTLALLVPAIAFYPSMFELGYEAKSQLVETRFAPQAINHRQTIQQLLQESLMQIDRFPGLADLVTVPAPAGTEAPTDRAFQVWRLTGLAMYPVTSAVELYDANGVLVSRFAFNLPADLTTVPRSDERACTWGVFEEVSPFFAEERRLLYAGRAVCGSDGEPLGSIVVHAMPADYANLPFIVSQSPYVELMRPVDPAQGEGVSGRDVEFAVYGWSRTPLYASGVTAWPLEDAVFGRIEESRRPLWAELRRGDIEYAVYLLNDRGGIYALGFPVPSPLDHLVNLAEITVLAFGTYLLLLVATAIYGVVNRRGTTARALLREVRASFYRKLLLAFIAAIVVPVAALAIATRTYVADQMRANVEQEAIRTASAARRVVEDLAAPRAAQRGFALDDNLMVWVSRLIDQDVNIFVGPRLLATSERNLFASGLLPTRTPADVYRTLQLRNNAATVVREQIGEMDYLVAGTSIRTQQLDAMLTVPLTSRELQIESQIDTLDRRVLLGALLFVFAGAAIGYWLAERIADPVSRLTRATRRIARGNLDARIVARSSDELRRLVDDFNRMASELQRHQQELERTHRLEAWAEMARQVAHEIKNPLTPIQLNAEHLRRVHADRGRPLSPVLEECVSTILAQVRLLRQIASEFSSFASSPTARPAPVAVPELVHDAIDPYRVGLSDRIRVEVDVPSNLPPVFVDRTLIARSLINIVENAIHAMPGSGALTIVARASDSVVRIRVTDTGVGMDAEALARAFEPYFSTKTTGTGLGLPIAKRNVELSGGAIRVTSERDVGTTVELVLPTADSNVRV
ncbi:MAG: HAMP domain-containing histidine kinase [Acidobacteria bacterium]|nr:HAMP domain-containing histidine kinase [Acidobacteriota bacterium]